MEFDLRAAFEGLSHSDPNERRRALPTLVDLAEPERAFDALRAVADTDPEPAVRFAARILLHVHFPTLPGPDVSPPKGLTARQLTKLLKQTDVLTRIRYLWHLTENLGARTLPLLADVVRRNADPWVLTALVRAFRLHGQPKDAERLLPLLRHPATRVVANTIEALVVLAPQGFVSAVAPFLGSPDNRVRANAVVACHRQAPRKVRPWLEAMADPEAPWMRASALWVIETLGADGMGTVLDRLAAVEADEGRLARIRALAGAQALEDDPRTTAIDPKKEGAGEGSKAQRLTVRVVSGEEEESAAGDSDLLVGLREDLAAADFEDRRLAVLALARTVDPEEALPELERVEASDPSPDLQFLARKEIARVRAATRRSRPVDNTVILARTAPQDDLPKLLERCRSENLPSFYAVLADRLGRAAVPLLQKEIEARRSPLIASALVHAMAGVLPPHERAGVMGPLLHHPSARVVAEAAELLGEAGDGVAQTLLVPLLSHGDRRVRACAVKALMRCDRTSALDTLQRMIESERLAARASARYALEMLDDPAAADLIVRLWRKEEDTGELEALAPLLAERLDGRRLHHVAVYAAKRRDRKGEIAEGIVRQVCKRLELDAKAVIAKASDFTTHLRKDELDRILAGQLPAPDGAAHESARALASKESRGRPPSTATIPATAHSSMAVRAFALVGFALIILLAVVIARPSPATDGTEGIPAPAVRSLEEASAKAQGGSLRGHRVRWEGRVVRRHPDAVVCKAGRRRFVAAGVPPYKLDLRRGDLVSVYGKIKGTNSSGVVYLVPLEWKLLSRGP